MLRSLWLLSIILSLLVQLGTVQHAAADQIIGCDLPIAATSATHACALGPALGITTLTIDHKQKQLHLFLIYFCSETRIEDLRHYSGPSATKA